MTTMMMMMTDGTEREVAWCSGCNVRGYVEDEASMPLLKGEDGMPYLPLLAGTEAGQNRAYVYCEDCADRSGDTCAADGG